MSSETFGHTHALLVIAPMAKSCMSLAMIGLITRCKCTVDNGFAQWAVIETLQIKVYCKRTCKAVTQKCSTLFNSRSYSTFASAPAIWIQKQSAHFVLIYFLWGRFIHILQPISKSLLYFYFLSTQTIHLTMVTPTRRNLCCRMKHNKISTI